MKFYADLWNHCRDMAILQFFKMAAMTVWPPSWIYFSRVWTTHEEYLVVLITAKFGWNRCISFNNMQVLIFCMLGLKMLICAPKMGF